MHAKFDKKLIKVLAIDPQQITLWGIGQLINQDPRFTVCETASNTEDALKAAADHQPSLILLEPDFENASGIELIASLQIICNAKIIILTSSRNSALQDQAIVKGARGVILKTESTDTLLKAMEKIYQGELWLNRNATSRILQQVTQTNAQKDLNPAQKKLSLLTPKEENVTRAIQLHSRKTLKEIAETLHISEHTLRNHLASIYDKIGVRNRMELYVFCGKYQKTTDPSNHPKRRATDI
ncbi:Two component transcriptional regulator, LuxR family [beta proteobacterium CB]|nr:Two component transcriptional regulator, LuxR family [beta proteobacterium CB]